MAAKSKLDKSIEATGVDLGKEEALDNSPVYRIQGDSKIPVSKHLGKLWEARKDQGVAARGHSQDRWDEAIRYYENDQTAHRKSRDNSSGNTVYAGRLNSEHTETENIVFSNCAVMVPLLYPKNPTVAFTPTNSANEGFTKALQALVNALFKVKEAPGLSLKSKMRRTVLTTQLTNRAYLKLEWVFKRDSDDTAIAQLNTLAEELASAKDMKKIKELEGQIMALEEKIALLSRPKK